MDMVIKGKKKKRKLVESRKYRVATSKSRISTPMYTSTTKIADMKLRVVGKIRQKLGRM